jgi:gas vesicle protein
MLQLWDEYLFRSIKLKAKIMSTGKVLLGVLAGIAVGAALGILFAPEKGSVTRKKISEKSDEYADDLVEKFNEFIESINEKFEKVVKETSDKAKDANLDAEDIKADVISEVK